MKKLLLRLYIVFILFCGVSAILNMPRVYAYPSNAFVRVGIMDNKYTTTEHKFETFYGTEEVIISSKTNNEILRLPTGYLFDITCNNGIFRICYIDPETSYGGVIESLENLSINCPNGIIGVKTLIRGGKEAMYRGEIRLIKCPNQSDKFYVVNCLDVEYYLKGVVPCEMPVTFGLEALKAQAVAARVYSLTPRTKLSREYDVVDSVASQVYNGYNRESDIANKAIDETHGLVALYDDNMIVAVFCSTAGGFTESYSETFSDPDSQQFPSKGKPYLIAKPDLPEFKPLDNEEDAYKFYSSKPISYDIHSPLYRWTRKWSKSELQKILAANLVIQSKTGFVEPKLERIEDFGTLQDIRVTQRGISGKIVFMEIETDNKIYTVSKELVIRRLFTKEGKALPSANVVFRTSGKSNGEFSDNNNWTEITAYGGGFGHGCGLSQYGAMYMAKDCKMSFETILKHYYNGICLGTKPFELDKNYVSQAFYAPKKQAVLVIPDRKNTEALQLKINEEIVNINLSGYNSRAELDISEYIIPKTLNTVTFIPSTHKRADAKNFESIKPVKMYIKLL